MDDCCTKEMRMKKLLRITLLKVSVLLIVAGLALFLWGIFAETAVPDGIPESELTLITDWLRLRDYVGDIVELAANPIWDTGTTRRFCDSFDRDIPLWEMLAGYGAQSTNWRLYMVEMGDFVVPLRSSAHVPLRRYHVPARVAWLEDDPITQRLLADYGVSSNYNLLPFALRRDHSETLGILGRSEDDVYVAIGFGVLFIFAGLIGVLLHFIIKRYKRKRKGE
jgi:hypothetical protein